MNMSHGYACPRYAPFGIMIAQKPKI